MVMMRYSEAKQTLRRVSVEMGNGEKGEWVQAAEEEHEANGYLLRTAHLKFQHIGYRYGEDADVAYKIDDADAEIKLGMSAKCHVFTQSCPWKGNAPLPR
jgi:hypothetical protein